MYKGCTCRNNKDVCVDCMKDYIEKLTEYIEKLNNKYQSSREIDSISIRGLRKAHIAQLVSYIRHRDIDGWYYGQRDQFEKRHADLLQLADTLDSICADPNISIAKIID